MQERAEVLGTCGHMLSLYKTHWDLYMCVLTLCFEPNKWYKLRSRSSQTKGGYISRSLVFQLSFVLLQTARLQ